MFISPVIGDLLFDGYVETEESTFNVLVLVVFS